MQHSGRLDPVSDCYEIWGASVRTGKVRWFNSDKGFGFIEPDSVGKDVYVHISAVESAGLNSLSIGQRVAFQELLSARSGKLAAANLRSL